MTCREIKAVMYAFQGPYFKDEDLEEYRSGRNGPDSKSGCLVKSQARGFESHLLR